MTFDHQNIHFISDLHLFHKSVLRYDNRPYKDVNEMHEDIITKWNNIIKKDDIVYNLGDVSFTSFKPTKSILDRLNGKMFLIMGNHDRIKEILKLDRFEKIHEYGTEIWVKDTDLNYKEKDGKEIQGYQQIILSHYPILEWNRAHHGSYHLHGHTHQSLLTVYPEYYQKRVMDVGCNGTNYTPVSYTQIKDVLSKKELSKHH